MINTTRYRGIKKELKNIHKDELKHIRECLQVAFPTMIFRQGQGRPPKNTDVNNVISGEGIFVDANWLHFDYNNKSFSINTTAILLEEKSGYHYIAPNVLQIRELSSNRVFPENNGKDLSIWNIGSTSFLNDCKNNHPALTQGIGFFIGDTKIDSNNDIGDDCLSAMLVQFSVGQGGFHCGIIDRKCKVLKKPFVFVYDCGTISNKPDKPNVILKNNVKIFDDLVGKKADIDLLVISHIDNDHVNGLKYLTKNHEVKKFVMPFFGDTGYAMWKVSQLPKNSKGFLIEKTLKYYTDFDYFLNEIGFKNNDTLFQFVVPDNEYLDNEYARHSFQTNEQQQRYNISYLNTDVNFNPINSSKIIWNFLPHIYSHYTKKGYAEFLENEFRILSTTGEFGNKQFRDLDYSEILNWLNKRKGFTKLRKIFRKYEPRIVTNSTSLSLLSYPNFSESCQVVEKSFEHNFIDLSDEKWCYGDTGGNRKNSCLCFETKKSGWLFTGDSNLSNEDERNDFFKLYNDYSGDIGILLAPHHGSPKGHSAEVFEKLSPRKILIPVGVFNRYGHPNVELLKRNDKHLVTQYPCSKFVQFIKWKV